MAPHFSNHRSAGRATMLKPICRVAMAVCFANEKEGTPHRLPKALSALAVLSVCLAIGSYTVRWERQETEEKSFTAQSSSSLCVKIPSFSCGAFVSFHFSSILQCSKYNIKGALPHFNVQVESGRPSFFGPFSSFLRSRRELDRTAPRDSCALRRSVPYVVRKKASARLRARCVSDVSAAAPIEIPISSTPATPSHRRPSSRILFALTVRARRCLPAARWLLY